MENKIDNSECHLIQDETSPDSMEYFEKELIRITGYGVEQFKKDSTRYEDELHMEWRNGLWVLEYDGDDPFYKLRKMKTTAIFDKSYYTVCAAFADSTSIYSYRVQGHTIGFVEVRVKAIFQTYFADTMERCYDYEIGWYRTQIEAFRAFSKTIEDALEEEEIKLYDEPDED